MSRVPFTPPSGRRARRVRIIAGVTVALLVVACLAFLRGGLFGPPRVRLREAYAGDPARAEFDHNVFDGLLRRVVTDEGLVDYGALRRAPGALDEYLAAVAGAPFDDLDRDGKLALLINAYNAFTLRLILDHWPLASIRDIPRKHRWDTMRWVLGGQSVSLSVLEHEYLRARFIEPRIHFAINCASVGCPPLRREAYTAERLESQLTRSAMSVHSEGSRWFRFDTASRRLRLTRIYDWYRADFEQVAGRIEDYAARFSPTLRRALEHGADIEAQWLDYDWRLNRAHPPREDAARSAARHPRRRAPRSSGRLRSASWERR